MGVIYHQWFRAFIEPIIKKYKVNAPLIFDSRLLMTIYFDFFIHNHSESPKKNSIAKELHKSGNNTKPV